MLLLVHSLRFKADPYNPESESDALITSPAEEIPITDLAPSPSRTIQKQWIPCSDCQGIGDGRGRVLYEYWKGGCQKLVFTVRKVLDIFLSKIA